MFAAVPSSATVTRVSFILITWLWENCWQNPPRDLCSLSHLAGLSLEISVPWGRGGAHPPTWRVQQLHFLGKFAFMLNSSLVPSKDGLEKKTKPPHKCSFQQQQKVKRQILKHFTKKPWAVRLGSSGRVHPAHEDRGQRGGTCVPWVQEARAPSS